MKSKSIPNHYSSFSEVAESVFGIKKKEKQFTEEERNKFLSHHKCNVCKQLMSYIPGTNVLACTNPACKGIKHTIKGDDEDRVFYTPSFHTLEKESVARYADRLFKGGEKND